MLFVLWPLISMARFSEISARIMLRTAVRRKSRINSPGVPARSARSFYFSQSGI